MIEYAKELIFYSKMKKMTPFKINLKGITLMNYSLK